MLFGHFLNTFGKKFSTSTLTSTYFLRVPSRVFAAYFHTRQKCLYQVDFDVLHEIFVGICMDKGIETPDFNFYQAMSSVIKEIEALAQKEEKFREAFKVANLGGIYQQLQKRGMELNFSFARQKYLRQLMIHNQRLQFTGIPDLKEKKDITIPSVFVMQRMVESVDVEDYERLILEKEHDENYQKLLRGVQGGGFLEKSPPGRRRQEKEPVKFDNVRDIIDEKFKPDDKRRFLEKVAFHLQSLEKGDEAGTVIDRHEVYKILFPDFCRVFQVDKWQAMGLVDEFLDKIRTRAGLLVEQAPDQYGFVHKTFQEYFAAKWIANEALLNFDLQIMINYVEQFIDNAFWQETLLLALRALPHTQTLKVLEYILNRDPKGIERYFYHNHYFVMKFIAEQGKWLDRRDFVEKQLMDFFDFSWDNGEDMSYYASRTWNRFKNWVAAVTDSLVSSALSDKFLSIAEDKIEEVKHRRSCAEAVGNLGIKEQTLVKRLLRLAEDEKQEGSLRDYCAEAPGKLGEKHKAVEILIDLYYSFHVEMS